MFTYQKLQVRLHTMCRILQWKRFTNMRSYPRKTISLTSFSCCELRHRLLSSTAVVYLQQLKPKQGAYSSNLCVLQGSLQQKQFYSTSSTMNDVMFEKLVEETLEQLCDFFEEIGDTQNCSSDYDVTYGDGVLTVKFGAENGTYVINKQTPNKQIWLSSPTSGPKRYDHMDNRWIYKHDGTALHDLLTEEISRIIESNLDFTKAELTER